MSNLNAEEVKDAWGNTVTLLAISDECLKNDLVALISVWANSSDAIKDDLPSAMQRLMALISGYIVGNRHNKLPCGPDAQADLTILAIDMITWIMADDGASFKGIRNRFGLLDGDIMVEAMKAKT